MSPWPIEQVWDRLPRAVRKGLERIRERYVARAGTRMARRARRAHARRPPSMGAALMAMGRRWRAPEADGAAPVFVLSASWRSGSTWLQRLLMTSGDIIVWGEPYDRAGLVQKLAAQLMPFSDAWPPPLWVEEPPPIGELAGRWVGNLYPPVPALVDAHRAFWLTLFASPARARGAARWGFKETRLGMDHARYLRFLFPDARFLFLVRDPFDAWESYRTWGDWYDEWPRMIATPRQFGRMWARLAADFLHGHAEVGGRLLRYEDLVGGRVDLDELGASLGLRLDPRGASARIEGLRHREKTPVPPVERGMLLREVRAVAGRLGYG